MTFISYNFSCITGEIRHLKDDFFSVCVSFLFIVHKNVDYDLSLELFHSKEVLLKREHNKFFLWRNKKFYF